VSSSGRLACFPAVLSDVFAAGQLHERSPSLLRRPPVGFEPVPRLPPQPSPKKTHRRRQQLDWGRSGACLLLPSLSKHSVDGGTTDLEGLGNLRSPHAFCSQLPYLGHVNRWGRPL
jgi:hypothetical protein